MLAKTLGVPLFQEQVIRLAMVAADYTPGEADQLRRDMAAWRKTGRIERHRERLVSRMTAKGIEDEFARARVRADPRLRRVRLSREPRRQLRADRLRDRVDAPAPPRRVHLLALNAQPMGFYTPATIIEDAKRRGLRRAARRRHGQRLGLRDRRKGTLPFPTSSRIPLVGK